MKKYLYSFLLLAVALVSTAAFVSCGSDDDDAPQASQASLDFRFWLSEDLQKIVDVKTTGDISSLSCTTPSIYEYDIAGLAKYSEDGYQSQTIHFDGQQAENAKFTVSLQLKSNWKELIAGKEKLNCKYGGLYLYIKNGSTRTNVSQAPRGNTYTVSKITADKAAEEAFAEAINRMSYSYPSATL